MKRDYAWRDRDTYPNRWVIRHDLDRSPNRWAIRLSWTGIPTGGQSDCHGQESQQVGNQTVMDRNPNRWAIRLSWTGIPNRVNRTLPPNKYPSWERALTKEGMQLLYDASDGNIFTKDNLQLIQTIEQRLVSVNQFSSYCQMTQSGTCKPPLSVLRFFDGTYAALNPVFNDPDFDNIPGVIHAAFTNNQTKSGLAFTLGKNHHISNSSVSCTLTRTLIPFGWPLPGYTDEMEMQTALTDFMVDHMKPVLDFYLDMSALDFLYFNEKLLIHTLFNAALYDMALAAGSLAFIFLFIWFHTRSLWVTCLAVLSIVCSFVETNLIYRVVIDFKYFGYFHVVAMFIILGIGADDLFVFWDAWKATGLQSHPSLAHRLNEAYRKSVISMLVTSLTTMAAFLSNAVSPLLATRSFGCFAAILVVINYLSVVTFFPTIIIFYHLHFEDKPHPNDNNDVWATRVRQTQDSGSDQSLEGKPSRLVIFFRDYYFAFVTHWIARWVIVSVFLGCLVGLGYSASRLESDKEPIDLYRDSHHFSMAVNLLKEGFVSNDQDETITIYLVWGLKENDLSSCHFSSIECRGDHRFDDSFQASTLAAQRAFVTICDDLFNFTDQQVSEYRIKRDLVSGQLEIACFPRNLQAFLEIPLTYWIWDAFQQNNTEDYQIFNSLFGEETDAYTSGVLTAPSIRVGNKIKYVAIAVNTTLNPRSLGHTEGIPIVERWEQFMTDQLKKMPEEMQSGFQTTMTSWHWLYVQRALAENAILGVGLGVSLALPVLVLSTGNVINGLLATLSICCVTVCVIGVIPLAGWRLGVLVSLNMCLVVGLAVDFVVHLAEGYHMSHRTDRRGRLQQALERMGISVFSGACTTLGASSFMLFAKIQFFFQFGIFMFCTMGFSLVFSMGLYVTVMGILGPEGDTGDIRVLVRKCCVRRRVKDGQHGLADDTDV
ncbi:protein dispatched homolog 1-like [Babylonia areolata]|uniref:protein dispatched homolog 1-like n=1 Tax=Babylonia areolata TaxID=304850 RepID=UPI003FD1F508